MADPRLQAARPGAEAVSQRHDGALPVPDRVGLVAAVPDLSGRDRRAAAAPELGLLHQPVGQLRHHFGPFLTPFAALHRPTRAVQHAHLSDHADWVLTGACNPMTGACDPISGFRSEADFPIAPLATVEAELQVRVLLFGLR